MKEKTKCDECGKGFTASHGRQTEEWCRDKGKITSCPKDCKDFEPVRYDISMNVDKNKITKVDDEKLYRKLGLE